MSFISLLTHDFPSGDDNIKPFVALKDIENIESFSLDLSPEFSAC